MLNLIPTPKSYKENNGKYILGDKIKVKSDFDLPIINEYVELCDDADIIITKDDSVAKEGYKLSVTEDGITITASTKTGAYYALQSIRQMGNMDLGGKEIPCCEIDDEPRFEFRGMQLDISRHFFNMDEIKQMLDMMFMHKLNAFHWHLTDDNGWRIEIKKYPLLTEIGSKRKFTQTGGWKSFKCENKPYEGYYTQDEIKEIIEYARERGITVIPEIDFPAHCAAALAGYKHLACREIDSEVFGFFGGIIPQWRDKNWRWNRTLCLGKETTYQFIYDVLDEICDLFDSPYIHIGGDEAPRDEWKDCPICQKTMKDNGIADIEQYQGWFENKINKYLKSKGRMTVGWNEILKSDNIDNDDHNIIVQYWTPQRDKNAEKYVNGGGKMIMSNHQSFYFDMPYAVYPVANTYNYKPENFGVTKDNVQNVLGVEGELWTEWIRDIERLQMLTYPRMQALAEVGWTPDDKKDFDSFLKRFENQKAVLNKYGITYAVDKVASPKGRIKRNHIHRKFHKGNPYLEVELNNKYKAKGEK